MSNIAYFHLPGLFEFYELYKKFLPLYFNHQEYFYDFVRIGSIYGSPKDTIFSGGRIEYSDTNLDDVLSLMNKYNIPLRLTFSNSCLENKHLDDLRCNEVLRKFENEKNGIIIYSDLLMEYIKNKYPKYHFISSTTKVLLSHDELLNEISDERFKYVVPDFRLNKDEFLFSLDNDKKNKLELLCNECCPSSCSSRKDCYMHVSKQILDDSIEDHICSSIDAKDGYRFSKVMKSKNFISINDIKNLYLPNGISNFKIEGRTLGSALVLEFLLYYMVKPEYQINIREDIYLDNSLDLF